jgi:hypothetical protein
MVAAVRPALLLGHRHVALPAEGEAQKLSSSVEESPGGLVRTRIKRKTVRCVHQIGNVRVTVPPQAAEYAQVGPPEDYWFRWEGICQSKRDRRIRSRRRGFES